MKLDIPGVGELSIKTLILDLNGTLSVGGGLVDGVKERIGQISVLGIKVVLFTGNTRNDADELADRLSIEWRLAKTAEDKKRLTEQLDPNECASVGNGLIDAEMMGIVRLGIVTLQAEGVHSATLSKADLVVPTINDALDLFIDPQRLIASLRK